MPIYVYQCRSCGAEIEVMQKVSDSPLTDCSKCGKNTLEKVIAPTQFQLKGTGWYVTDFKNSGAKKEDKKEKKDTSDSEGSKTEVGSAKEESK